MLAVHTSPFTSRLFREVPTSIVLSKSSKQAELAMTAKEWLHYEAVGRLGEEGLVDDILGPEEHEEERFKDAVSKAENSGATSAPSYACTAWTADDNANGASEPNSVVLRVAMIRSHKQAGWLP